MADSVTWRESTITCTGGWDVAAAAWPGRSRLILSDLVGGACAWSLSPEPAKGQGCAFSGKLATGSYSFPTPVPSNAVFVQGLAGTVVSVMQA